MNVNIFLRVAKQFLPGVYLSERGTLYNNTLLLYMYNTFSDVSNQSILINL